MTELNRTELRASVVAQMVKNLPAMWETKVLSLGQEDPLQKGMVTHSSILAWTTRWIEEPGGLSPNTVTLGIRMSTQEPGVGSTLLSP